MVRYAPKQGDIVWLEFDHQTGKEIQKTRPALTVSPHGYNLKTGLGLFIQSATPQNMALKAMMGEIKPETLRPANETHKPAMIP